MVTEEDRNLLRYAGLYSRHLRKLDEKIDSSPADEGLMINLDVEEELRDQNGLNRGTASREEDVHLKRKQDRQLQMDIEKAWNPLTDREPTVQDEREWRALQLRGFMDPKKFYKGANSGTLEPLPRRYQVGVMVGSAGVSAGSGEESQAAGAVNSRRRKKGLSVLKDALNADQRWTKKKYREIQSEKTSGSKGWYSRERAKLKKSAK